MMSSSIAAGNKKINALFLPASSTVIHHAPFYFLLLYLYLSYLRKNIIMFHFISPNKGEAKANLILKKTEWKWLSVFRRSFEFVNNNFSNKHKTKINHLEIYIHTGDNTKVRVFKNISRNLSLIIC